MIVLPAGVVSIKRSKSLGALPSKGSDTVPDPGRPSVLIEIHISSIAFTFFVPDGDESCLLQRRAELEFRAPIAGFEPRISTGQSNIHRAPFFKASNNAKSASVVNS